MTASVAIVPRHGIGDAAVGDVLSLVISGIASGSAYALLALGVVIIFRSTDTVNFAIGDTGTFASFTALSAMSAGLSVLLAFPLAILVAGILGVVSERLLVRPLGYGKHVLFVALVITIGLGLVMQAAMGEVSCRDGDRVTVCHSAARDLAEVDVVSGKNGDDEGRSPLRSTQV